MTRVTRVNGQLIVHHDTGKIVFKVRSTSAKKKHGTNTILTIENAGSIPMLQDGKELHINSMEVGLNVTQGSIREDQHGPSKGTSEVRE
jgi:hypothetical protein